jgi:hypothetical protein
VDGFGLNLRTGLTEVNPIRSAPGAHSIDDSYQVRVNAKGSMKPAIAHDPPPGSRFPLARE